jgi:hypothetical protein
LYEITVKAKLVCVRSTRPNVTVEIQPGRDATWPQALRPSGGTSPRVTEGIEWSDLGSQNDIAGILDIDEEAHVAARKDAVEDQPEMSADLRKRALDESFGGSVVSDDRKNL